MIDPLTDGQLAEIVELLSDPEKLLEGLPLVEREEYERCQRSVVEARRHAEAYEGQWIVL